MDSIDLQLNASDIVAHYLPDGRLRAGSIDYSSIEQANHVRAGWAAVALSAYLEAAGGGQNEVDVAVGDLIGDLLHLLAAHPDACTRTIDETLARARAYYDEEQEEY